MLRQLKDAGVQRIVETRAACAGSQQVYSALLLTDDEESDSPGVVISPSKVMNTVCGLARNSVLSAPQLAAKSQDAY